MADFNYLLTLPGEDRERDWIRERLETLSVREAVVLSAAAQRTLPENMEQAINCLQSLDDYDVRLDAGSYAALGQSYLLKDTMMPKNALHFVDLTMVGQQYEDEHPGLFVGNHYVQYPEEPSKPIYQQGGPLPNDDDWSVKLKLASPAVPEGVWLRLPGRYWGEDDPSTDESLALQELRAKRWDECDVLEARCVLPQIERLMEQYDDVADLIYDGTALGYVLSQRGQGMPNFIEHYTAVLELEHCHDLRLALDISQNLNCYDWVPQTDLAISAEGLLLDAGVSKKLIYSSGIDLEGYKAYLLEADGYTSTADKSGYIRKNGQEFHYQFSTPAHEEPGMTMQ